MMTTSMLELLSASRQRRIRTDLLIGLARELYVPTRRKLTAMRIAYNRRRRRVLHQTKSLARTMRAREFALDPIVHFDPEGRPMSFVAWCRAIELGRHKRVALTRIKSRCFVSTVWLGTDHSFGEATLPIIFETMIFCDTKKHPELAKLDERQWRYATHAQALEGHDAVVALARAVVSGSTLANEPEQLQ